MPGPAVGWWYSWRESAVGVDVVGDGVNPVINRHHHWHRSRSFTLKLNEWLWLGFEHLRELRIPSRAGHSACPGQLKA